MMTAARFWILQSRSIVHHIDSFIVLYRQSRRLNRHHTALRRNLRHQYRATSKTKRKPKVARKEAKRRRRKLRNLLRSQLLWFATLTYCSQLVTFIHFFCLCKQQAVEAFIMFPGRPSVRPSVHLSVFRPLTPVSRDAISLCLVKRFQWNLTQIFVMWLAILPCYGRKKQVTFRRFWEKREKRSGH